MNSILMINGPNLNWLGKREQDMYGAKTLKAIEKELRALAEEAGVKIQFFQSNSEGDIISKIQQAHGRFHCLIINPAAYTHTSVAIRDAIATVQIPTIEVHISNIYKREEFRQRSLIAPVASGQITGFGPYSYVLAFYAAQAIMEK